MLEMVVAAETQGMRGSVAKLRCVSECVRKGKHYKVPEMGEVVFVFSKKKKNAAPDVVRGTKQFLT